MKKFLIGIILLIPVIVVITLSATSSIIASSVTVMPKYIQIKNSDNTETDSSPITVDINEKDAFIIINVYPEIVADDNINYTFDDIENATGNLDLYRVGESNRYRIEPKSPGLARVIISSILNINISKAVTFWISSDTVETVELYDGGGNNIENIAPLAPERIYYDIQPIDALNNVTFESSNESIVRITKNGTLIPVSHGKTVVSIEVIDKAGKVHNDYLMVDTTSALVNSLTAYTTSEPNENWVYDNLVIEKNAEVRKTGANRYAVSYNGNSVEVYAASCAAGEWGFIDEPGVIYTRNGPYYLNVGYLDFNYGEKLYDYTLASGDVTVARVDGNEIIPLRAGNVDITAYSGGASKTITLTVRERPLNFDLELNKEDAERGIKLDRVWGYKWFKEDGGFTNTYQFGAKARGGKDDAGFDLYWSVSDPRVAQITQDALITFLPESVGKAIKVTASVIVNNRLTKTARSFTFKIKDNENSINVHSFEEAKKASELSDHEIILQNDILPTEDFNLSNNLFGNGFTVSGALRENSANAETRLITVSDNINGRLESLIIEDAVIEGTTEFDSNKAFFVGVFAYQISAPLTFKNLIIKNAYRGFDVRNLKELLVEGCILGENYSASGFVCYDPPGDGKITLKNNILKYSEGPSIIMGMNSFEQQYFNQNILPELIIDGFFEVYNWKRADRMSDVMNGIGLNVFDSVSQYIEPDKLITAINNVFDNLFSSPEMASLFYTDKNGDRYGSLGIFVVGAMSKNDPSRIKVYAENIDVKEAPLSGVSGIAGNLIDIINVITSAQGMPISNSFYIVGYDYREKAPIYKPGDPIPQNLELYRRLNGYYAEKDI